MSTPASHAHIPAEAKSPLTSNTAAHLRIGKHSLNETRHAREARHAGLSLAEFA